MVIITRIKIIVIIILIVIITTIIRVVIRVIFQIGLGSVAEEFHKNPKPRNHKCV